VKFEEVLRRCALGTAGYLRDIADLDRLETVIATNVPVLSTFAEVAVATNFADFGDESLKRAHRRLWRAYLPDAVLIDHPVNRGHSIGTFDLDNALVEWCSAGSRAWLCRSANDVTLSPHLFEVEVSPAHFYFINAVSVDAIEQQSDGRGAFEGDFFYPQGTFWVMKVDGIRRLVDPEFLDASWRIVNSIAGYNGRIWEYLPGWTYEYLLRRAVLDNHVSRCSLLTPQQWREVLDLTVERRLHDCSLKGVDVVGICHTQGLEDPTKPWASVR